MPHFNCEIVKTDSIAQKGNIVSGIIVCNNDAF